MILAIWAVGVCAIYSISAAYGKTTNSYKRYKDALIRYERFLKSPEKFIYKKLDEFDLNDYHARVETINLDNAKWTIVIGKNEEEQDEFENLDLSKDQIIKHNKSVLANEISVILNKNKEILKKVTDKNGNNFYDVYKSYAFYNEFLKLEAYERALKELKEMLNEIDKIKFKAVFQKE